MKPRRVSLRQKLLVGGLVVVLLVLAVMVRPLAYQNPQQIGQGLTASTAPETRAAQIASEAAQVSNITLTQIEKIVRKQLPNLTNATFDGDRLLDGLVRAHHDVSVVRLNALGGLAQLSFTVSGYQGMVEISMEHFESEWMLTSIK
jgi:hypothetical protein